MIVKSDDLDQQILEKGEIDQQIVKRRKVTQQEITVLGLPLSEGLQEETPLQIYLFITQNKKKRKSKKSKRKRGHLKVTINSMRLLTEIEKTHLTLILILLKIIMKEGNKPMIDQDSRVKTNNHIETGSLRSSIR